MPGKSVLVLWVNVQQIIMILGFVVADLAHTMPIIFAKFEFLILGCFPHFTNPFLVANVFPQPKILYLTVCIFFLGLSCYAP